MAGGVAAQGISGKRAQLAEGRVGWRGLFHSKKTFGISLFASLGGLVYGCMYFRAPSYVQAILTDFKTTRECLRKFLPCLRSSLRYILPRSKYCSNNELTYIDEWLCCGAFHSAGNAHLNS